jgi:transglutaminase-like putative cysteine protease
MRALLLLILCVVSALIFWFFRFSQAEPSPLVRRVNATYTATVDSIPPGTTRLEAWIPLPAETQAQSVLALDVESSYATFRRYDAEFGNAYLYTKIEKAVPPRLNIQVRFQAERREVLNSKPVSVSTWNRSPDILTPFLRPSRLVTVSPRILKLAQEITRDSNGTVEKARAIYNYVVNGVRYDKSIPGWGRGDTERVCDLRTGNCTDFHSLFISLAMASGIPARFVIGFPLSQKPKDSVTGYHCWADFYLPGRGWIPVDASDASKSQDPKRRDYLFGNLDPDRLQFTVGRDIRFSPAQSGEPLNYFIYPYAEADGKPITDTGMQLDYANL